MRLKNADGTYPPWLPGNAPPTNDENDDYYLANVATHDNPDTAWIEKWQMVGQPSSTFSLTSCQATVTRTATWFATHRSLWPSLQYASMYVPIDGTAPIRDIISLPNIPSYKYRQTTASSYTDKVGIVHSLNGWGIQGGPTQANENAPQTSAGPPVSALGS